MIDVYALDAAARRAARAEPEIHYLDAADSAAPISAEISGGTWQRVMSAENGENSIAFDMRARRLARRLGARKIVFRLPKCGCEKVKLSLANSEGSSP